MKYILLLLGWRLAAAVPAAFTCSTCHRAETSSYPSSKMHGALETDATFGILRRFPQLSADIGGYSYRIERQGDTSVYTVSDGKKSITTPLRWAFGAGSMGQTYVLEREGKWYESRVSFYSDIRGLDLTMGAQNIPARTLEEAAGRLMGEQDARECFNCHSTHAVSGGALHTEDLTAGVQCERCHTQAPGHLRALQTRDTKHASMPKLSRLTTEETSDFCGQCHRTWSQIASTGPHSILNIRFQPYRLTDSKCYDADDKRIACTACHNPHAAPERQAAAYDAKCLACHSPSVTPANKASLRICKVGASRCTTCHMPKIELPGSHYKFSDHEIRIVRANEPYPS